MPAAEAIYTPYDFRFIYSQCIGSVDPRVSNVKIREDEEQQFSFTDAALWNAEEMAIFSTDILHQNGRYMRSETLPIIRR